MRMRNILNMERVESESQIGFFMRIISLGVMGRNRKCRIGEYRQSV